MTIDTARMQQRANNLLTTNGRPVTIRQTSDEPLNAAQPELGPETTPIFDVEVTGVLLDYTAEDVAKDPLRRGKQRLLIAVPQVEGIAVELATEAEIDGVQYRVEAVEKFQPGVVAFYYDCRVSR